MFETISNNNGKKKKKKTEELGQTVKPIIQLYFVYIHKGTVVAKEMGIIIQNNTNKVHST